MRESSTSSREGLLCGWLAVGKLKPAIAAAATFAVVSMAVDFSGERFIGERLRAV